MKIATFILLLLSSTACGLSFNPNPQDPGSPPLNVTYDSKMRLALGGTLPGWDQLEMDGLKDSDEVKVFISPETLAYPFLLNATETSRIFQMIPLTAGIGEIRYSINGTLQKDTIVLVIPPQEMIQILMGEARSVISSEVSLDEQGYVSLESQSPTATALLAVVRNRLEIIFEEDAPYLFWVSQSDWDNGDLATKYSLIIKAHKGSSYQFSPVNPADPGFEAYTEAQFRDQLSFASRILVYDQALLTAADVFDNTLADPTGMAFGFYSPSKAQYEALLTGLGSATLPAGIGTSDGQFPALAPIQVRILSEISPQSFDNELPSFVFVGQKKSWEKAVIEW